MKSRKPTAWCAMLVTVLAGCTRPYANFAIETTPAAGMMKSKTVSVELPKDASALAHNTYKVIVDQMKREGFKVVPKNGQVTMQMDAYRGNKSVGSRVNYRVFHSSVEEEYADVVTIEMHAIEKGVGIWDGHIEGLGEFLSGKYAPGCI